MKFEQVTDLNLTPEEDAIWFPGRREPAERVIVMRETRVPGNRWSSPVVFRVMEIWDYQTGKLGGKDKKVIWESEAVDRYHAPKKYERLEAEAERRTRWAQQALSCGLPSDTQPEVLHDHLVARYRPKITFKCYILDGLYKITYTGYGRQVATLPLNEDGEVKRSGRRFDFSVVRRLTPGEQRKMRQGRRPADPKEALMTLRSLGRAKRKALRTMPPEIRQDYLIDCDLDEARRNDICAVLDNRRDSLVATL